MSLKTSSIKRGTGTAHRSARTTPDLLGAVSTAPTVPVAADSTVVEGALAGVNHFGAYVIRNGFGVTMASDIVTQLAVAGDSVRLTIPAAFRVTDTDAVYEIFFAAVNPPLHVCRFTAAQLAAGDGATTGCRCIVEDTPLTNGTADTWECDIGVVGTGAATTAAQFAVSTAYTLGTITPVNCAGYNNVDVYVDASETAYTATAPVLVLLPVFLDDVHGTNYHVGAPLTVNLLGTVGYSFRQVFNLTVNSAYVAILVASIANVTVNRIDVTPTSVV